MKIEKAKIPFSQLISHKGKIEKGNLYRKENVYFFLYFKDSEIIQVIF